MVMMVVMLVMVMLVMLVSSRKYGSLRLRGLRILGADRCASGRTLGGTEPVIRKSGNWSAAATLFSSLGTTDAATESRLCAYEAAHQPPPGAFEPGNCWC